MHIQSLRINSISLVIGLAILTSFSVAHSEAATPTLWLIGDSTVKNGIKGLRGGGEEIGALFDPAKITVQNCTLGGRRSRTFMTEGLWDRVAAEIKPGDFLMQFGPAISHVD